MPTKTCTPSRFATNRSPMSFAQKLLWGMGGSAATLSVLSIPSVSAHCQVPCGIFNDGARIESLREDTTTIAKAQRHITSLSADSAKDRAFVMNQGTRWVTTKETHADDIIRSVSEYFLAQRVKVGLPDHAAYLDKLARHHAVMVAAMKCKQSTDPATAEVLKAAIDALAQDY